MFQLGERLQHQLILIREQGINPTKQFTSKATWLSVLLLLDLAQSDQMTWISTPQPSECRKCGFSLHRTQTPPPVPQSVLKQERRGCSRPEIQLLNIYFFSFSPPSYFNFFLFWKWHQLIRESQASLDTLVDYCTVSAFIFHLSTRGYTLDFDQAAWTAFQKVSPYSTVLPVTRRAAPTLTGPNQLGFSSRTVL